MFPNSTIKALIGKNDIYLDFLPVCDASVSELSTDSSIRPSFSEKCHHVTEFQQCLDNELSYIDTILHQLREYYDTVKTKRQLGLEAPAGFRRETNQKQNSHYATPPRRSTLLSPESNTSSINPSTDLPFQSTVNTPVHSNCASHAESSTPLSSPPRHISLVRSVNKVSSSLPNVITMSEDFICGCMGYHQIDTLKQHLPNLYETTIKLDSTSPDAILDQGNFATMKKRPRNTMPVPRSEFFADVIHMDIIFGPEVSVGNIHYGMIFTDRYSRMTYIYPLHNLSSDIPKQLQSFFAHIGCVPKRLISDFDLKLIGGSSRDYLNSLLVHVNAAPSYRQDKNGLAERHWQTLTSMARNWLASAELPSSFWYFAVHRASEVCNYFPFCLEDGTLTTPYELVHHKKPDLRTLFKQFGLAAVRHERHGDESIKKFESQSLPMIAIGKCQNLNGLQFYNPMNGTFVSSIDYVFQDHVTSGSRFGYKYQPGTFIY